MSFKEAMKKCCKVAAIMVMIIIPFIAGICTKEGASNGFETFIGWAAMAEAVAIAVLGIVLGRKRDDSAGK